MLKAKQQRKHQDHAVKITRAKLVTLVLVCISLAGLCIITLTQNPRAAKPSTRWVSRPVKIFLKPECPFCVAARNAFSNMGIQPELIDISGDPLRRSEMIRLSEGQKTVPQIFIGNQHIGGFQDLQRLKESGGLDHILDWRPTDSEPYP